MHCTLTEKLNLIDTHFDWNNRYNIWSGIIGGFFLQLSYFGTDQSQVGRYLTGESDRQSKLGLVMNGLVKIPMQFLILLIGVLVFVFYQFHQQPVFFNKAEITRIENSAYKNEFKVLEAEHADVHNEKAAYLQQLNNGLSANDQRLIDDSRDRLQAASAKEKGIRKSVTELMHKNDSAADTNDTNYVFLVFVTSFLPVGLVGLLIAIIFLASMGSTASGLNSLASTTTIDIYKRLIRKNSTDHATLSVSRWSTAGWGIFCVIVGVYAGKMGNLLEAVNILGSLFYGTILGIFVVAFYLKRVQGKAVFYAAVLTEACVAAAWYTDLLAFLWLNVFGCLMVVILAWIFQVMTRRVNAT